MNGRCHKDALDRAEDICELCGHQFCAQCVLYPRGRRNPPTCKTCALENSGLRGSSSKGQPISKREYKKRKKALLEVLDRIEAEQPVLEPFELRDPSAFDQSTELDRRIQKLEAEKPVDILASDDEEQEEPPVPPPPARAPTPPPEPPPAPTPSSRIEEAVTGMAPVDTSVNPLALDFPARPAPAPTAPDPTPAAAVTPEPASAAELLARLKADQPIQSQFHQSAPALDADPFAATAPAPAPTDDPFSATAPASTPAPSPAPVTGQPAFGATPAPAPAPTPTPAAPQSKSGAWSPPTPPPRGTVLDDDATPIAPSPTPAPAAAPPPIVPDPAEAHAEPETPKRRSADTDETGQWIPPSLRGMAAPDEREPLPKRR